MTSQWSNITSKNAGQLVVVLFVLCRLAQAAVSTCGGTLYGTTGTFTSPNYPYTPLPQPAQSSSGGEANVDNYITCVWEIIAPMGHGIQLNFGDFNMAAGQDQCSKGQIEIWKNVGDNKQFQDRYCGSDEISVINLVVPNATVIFRRPRNFAGNGFLVSYIATNPPMNVKDFVTCVDVCNRHVGVGEFSVICPGGCANISSSNVYGSENKYRDDSHLCRAAVHAGIINDRFGGRIAVKKKSGQVVYRGSFANEVQTEGAALSHIMCSFLNVDECEGDLKLSESDFSASSTWIEVDEEENKTYTWGPDKALEDTLFAWSPDDPTTEQWLQVDLRKVTNITAIITNAAKQQHYHYTKNYTLQFSMDGENWEEYKEEGMEKPKIFKGNSNYIKPSRNDFIRPSIIAQYLRVYPIPATSEIGRYMLKVALKGCEPHFASTPPPPIPKTTAQTSNVVTTKEKDSTTAPTEPIGKVPQTPPLNETSIIVMAIVAALVVTTILLAACVLILVQKKRKKSLKTVKGEIPDDRMHLNNNNLNGQYLNGYERKKSKSRKLKGAPVHNRNETIEFQNINYKDTIINAMQGGAPSTALLIPPNPHVPVNGFPNGDRHASDSFESDDDHEYQVIPDQIPNSGPLAPPSVHSQRTGSSKHSTGSSLHSRKSDTMQRIWVAQGEPRSPVFDTSTPTFPLQRSFSQNKPQMSTFMAHDKRVPARSNSSVTSNSVPRLPPNNPRRSSSKSPSNFHPPNTLEYADSSHQRQNSLGARPYYSAVPNDGGNISPLYKYPNPNAPLFHNNQNMAGGNNINGEPPNFRSESMRAAKQRQGYDRLYRNKGSPTGDNLHRKLSLQDQYPDSTGFNSYDKLDLAVN